MSDIEREQIESPGHLNTKFDNRMSFVLFADRVGPTGWMIIDRRSAKTVSARIVILPGHGADSEQELT